MVRDIVYPGKIPNSLCRWKVIRNFPRYCIFFEEVSHLKKNLTLRKVGLFYQAFDEDAEILHYLFNYRMVKGVVGFPNNALSKVLNTLEEKKISYHVIGDEEINKDFKNINSYSSYLMKAKNKVVVGERVEKILKKIDTLKEEQLIELLDKIEELINESE